LNRRQGRIIFVAVVLSGVALATVLALTAIGENMLYFFSPSQVKAGDAPQGRTLRVGGLVVEGSLRREPDSLQIQFDLTDRAEQISVRYTGILPDLFREGQGIVALGTLDPDGVFQAQEVLAKHDENYMPPEVAEALKMARDGGQIAGPYSDPRPLTHQ
jgi:cytochrome c-type biogenesis protein CcmE